jgi:hypothetical protein
MKLFSKVSIFDLLERLIISSIFYYHFFLNRSWIRRGSVILATQSRKPWVSKIHLAKKYGRFCKFFFFFFCFYSVWVEGEEKANAESFERINSDFLHWKSVHSLGSYRFLEPLDIFQYIHDRWLGVKRIWRVGSSTDVHRSKAGMRVQVGGSGTYIDIDESQILYIWTP